MSENTPNRFRITWTNTGYYVSIPNYRGGEVVPVEIADALVRALEECQAALAMMIEPETIQETSTLHAWSHAVAAERKARATLSSAPPVEAKTEVGG